MRRVCQLRLMGRLELRLVARIELRLVAWLLLRLVHVVLLLREIHRLLQRVDGLQWLRRRWLTGRILFVLLLLLLLLLLHGHYADGGLSVRWLLADIAHSWLLCYSDGPHRLGCLHSAEVSPAPVDDDDDADNNADEHDAANHAARDGACKRLGGRGGGGAGVAVLVRCSTTHDIFSDRVVAYVVAPAPVARVARVGQTDRARRVSGAGIIMHRGRCRHGKHDTHTHTHTHAHR